jgi:hypothetical protein
MFWQLVLRSKVRVNHRHSDLHDGVRLFDEYRAHTESCGAE